MTHQGLVIMKVEMSQSMFFFFSYKHKSLKVIAAATSTTVVVDAGSWEEYVTVTRQISN